jgi:hypothetical protein
MKWVENFCNETLNAAGQHSSRKWLAGPARCILPARAAAMIANMGPSATLSPPPHTTHIKSDERKWPGHAQPWGLWAKTIFSA